MRMKIGEKVFSKLLKINDEPRIIAKGFALGSFVGMMPVPGFQMFISATLAILLRWNKTAAIVGVFNTNLVTGTFIFAFNYWLGRKILGIESSFKIPDHINVRFIKIIINAGSEVFQSLLVGGLINGIISFILGYYLLLMILLKKQKRQNDNI